MTPARKISGYLRLSFLTFLPADWSSVLMYLTEGRTDEHLEMLAGGVIRQLLDEKWKTFAKVGTSDQLNYSHSNPLYLRILFASGLISNLISGYRIYLSPYNSNII